MSDFDLVIFAIASFLSSIVSGIAGAGGGFIMTPLNIFLGLSPAQSVATGKISGLTVTLGSLSGLQRAHGKASMKRIIPVMVLAFLVGLAAPFAIKSLDPSSYRIIMGVLLIITVPLLLKKGIGLKPKKVSRTNKFIGGGLLAFALFLQGIFSGGLGALVNIVLMGILGMTALEANITKRWSQLILNTMIVIGVIGSGLIVWKVALLGVITTFTGGFVGGRIAVKKGDAFILDALAAISIVSAVFLIIGA